MTEMIKFDDSDKLPEKVQEQLADDAAANMEGVEPRLPKVIMPTGKGKDFTIENHSEEDIETKEFVGVILYQSAANAWWEQKFGQGDAVVPDCASHDGITPSSQYKHLQSDTCAKCKHNQFGSAVDDAGEKAPGKACRNVKRVVVLRMDDPEIPVLMTVPPSSIPSFNDYMVTLKKKKRPHWSVGTKFFIKTQSNKRGIDFPQVQFEIAGFVNKEEQLTELKQTRETWMDMIKSTMFTADDTVSESKEPTVDPNAPVEY